MSDHQSPGEYVRSMMEAKGWTQTDLAFALGTTTSAVNQILSNKRGISANMARALGIALGEAPEKFARAQADWDVGNAESPADQVAARSRVLTKYPLREMIKRGWIDPRAVQRSRLRAGAGRFG
ncbi:MAG: helix-turn-helix domain-containing protein [Alphaproteobacteria bacterium]|nr:helix-turn-helix domain-containing protein [Alphaproteobacteria bacterium]